MTARWNPYEAELRRLAVSASGLKQRLPPQALRPMAAALAGSAALPPVVAAAWLARTLE